MSLFVIFLYCMSQPYMFRASISPSSGVSLAVVTCCHLVHAYEKPKVHQCQTGKKRIRIQEHQTKAV